MIVIKNKFIPFEGYETINLFGILFTRGDIDYIEYNHEGIHTVQLFECMLLSAIIILLLSMIFKFSLLWVFLNSARSSNTYPTQSQRASHRVSLLL